MFSKIKKNRFTQFMRYQNLFKAIVFFFTASLIKKNSILFPLSTLSAETLKAQVRVLEAPLFKEPNEDSVILQYVRKGEWIKIYYVDTYRPSDTLVDHVEQKNIDQLNKEHKDFLQKHPDSLFHMTPSDIQKESDSMFFKTRDRLAREAYIKKSHLHLFTNDRRELTQEPLYFDETDYRIHEPLPKGFPFKDKMSKNNISQIIRLELFNPTRTQVPSLMSGQTIQYQWFQPAREKNLNRVQFGGFINFEFLYSQSFTERSVSIGPGLSYLIDRTQNTVWSLTSHLYITPLRQAQTSSGVFSSGIHPGIKYSLDCQLAWNEVKNIQISLGQNIIGPHQLRNEASLLATRPVSIESFVALGILFQ